MPPPRLAPLLLSLLALALPVLAAETDPMPSSVPVPFHEEGYCSMTDNCGQVRRGVKWTPLPCPVNKTAVVPTGTHLQRLVSVCGEEFAGDTCCAESQLVLLEDQLKQATPILGTCLACIKNFRKFWCEFTCSPNQSQFLRVSDYIKAERAIGSTKPPENDTWLVNRVEYFPSQKFVSDFYDSCKYVQSAATNGDAMVFFGNAKNFSNFVNFLGTNPLTPFIIDFPTLMTPEELPPPSDGNYATMNKSTFPCDHPEYGCSCIDCPKFCPPLPPYEEPAPPCTFGDSNLPCLAAYILIAYVAISASILVIFAITTAVMAAKRKRQYASLSKRDPRASPTKNELKSGSNSSGSSAHSSDEDIADPIVSANHVNGNGSIQATHGEHANLLPNGNANDRDLEEDDAELPEDTADEFGEHPTREYALNTFISHKFFALGLFSARHPKLIIFLAFILIGLCSLGMAHFQVETDPVNLWVGPNSESKVQKNFFDSKFGPFFRTQMLIITDLNDRENLDRRAEEMERLYQEERAEQGKNGYSDELYDPEAPFWELNIFKRDLMLSLFRIEREVYALKGKKTGATFRDLCLKPLGPNSACVVQSVTGFWQGSEEYFNETAGGSGDDFEDDGWKDALQHCIKFKGSLECLPAFKQPLDANVILGGYTNDPLWARAIVVTFVVENSNDPNVIEKAKDWEEAFIEYVQNLKVKENKEQGISIAFNAEVSIENELSSESTADISTIGISYALMFLYASIALGRFSRISRIPIDSRFFLGICGILIVLASVLISIGVWSSLGVSTTLIIAEVIPFLVLAVGVDNVFILSHTFERISYSSRKGASPHALLGLKKRGVPVETRVALALGTAGPSILLAAVAETIAFALGTVVTMPAVRSFAMYASLAIAVDFLLQVTVFVVCLSIDAKRAEANRADCFPCVTVIREEVPEVPGEGDDELEKDEESFLQGLFRKYYAPVLMNRFVKIGVIIFFIGLTMAGGYFLTLIERGLDQRIALPRTSYLVEYFTDLETYLKVGSPVYFVVTPRVDSSTGLIDPSNNVTVNAGQAPICGRFSGCNSGSIVNLILQESKLANRSRIALPAADWLDDFMNFLDPTSNCCRYRLLADGTEQYCQPEDPDADDCLPCRSEDNFNLTLAAIPPGEEFMHYLDFFLEAIPGELCALGGSAAYQTAVYRDPTLGTVTASHFRTYHTVLKTQADFIDGYEKARAFAQDLSEASGYDVFAYSVFYVFFEQYLEIVSLALTVVGSALGAIFVVSWILLGSARMAAVLTVVVLMIVTDLAGVMGLFKISLNALSSVNLVISIGIGVEFCAHIVKSFSVTRGSKTHRAIVAVSEMGSSVFSGITLTKFLGIVVLFFAKSAIFEVYYFRMYLAIVILGALHGLVLVPVLLSYFGPPAVVTKPFKWREA